MVAMKRVLVLFTFGVSCIAGADLSGIHAVYLLPMGGALDQYLANRLTSEHVFQVVTDPKLADAVFTDRIGDGFEEKLADLYAPPPKEKPAESQPATDQAPPPANQRAAQPPPPLFTDTVNKLTNPATNSSFGRGKGTIFLVDRRSKEVLWSIYEVPKGTASPQMDRSAADIVNRLKRDLKKPEDSNR
jgi:hypothetical protein